MLHIVHLIQRRYPGRGDSIITRLLVVSGVAMALGIGLLLLAR